MLCERTHGNVLDRTLSKKGMFMHLHAILQLIMWGFLCVCFVLFCFLSIFLWFCSETVEAKQKKRSQPFWILVADVTLLDTALENDPYIYKIFVYKSHPLTVAVLSFCWAQNWSR